MSGTADGELQRKIEEYQSREKVYMAGIMGQEGEMCRLKAMASDVLGAYGDGSRASLRSSLFYPTANMEVLMLRQKMRDREQQITHLREELEANRFDQKLPAGQALMKKCKALLLENKELGEEIKDGRSKELRVALDAEKNLNQELYQKVNEAAEFCKELSDENAKLQGTIAKVAGRLRESKGDLEVLVKERTEAKKRRKLERDANKIEASLRATVTATAAGVAAPPVQEPILQANPAQEIAEQPAAPTVDVFAPQQQVQAPGAEPVIKEKKKKEKKDKQKKRKSGEIDG